VKSQGQRGQATLGCLRVKTKNIFTWQIQMKDSYVTQNSSAASFEALPRFGCEPTVVALVV
jgi:hypothetical protein